eukprot:TRINITY_DN55573_c0_g1_i1.p1 TRINITY_DN55573_c0_g1~~TRINITY_DN55573_c0_g1_i1.p1  ORF type:complete len:100 (+),score=22.71 TRINITY_DN55573_c0_g1_i1:96-395(+)
MMQFLPVIAYFLTQQFVASKFVVSTLPQTLSSWLPLIACVVTFVISNKVQGAQMDKQTSQIEGSEAPDFDIEFKDKKTTLKKLMEETGLPVVVDFYANF